MALSILRVTIGILLVLSVIAKYIGISVNRSLENFAHDSRCFTQGLVIDQGIIYESCGHYHKSTLRQVDLKTGKVLKSVKIAPNQFAEGITIVNNTLYMLTWKEKVLEIYDKKTLEHIGTRTIETSNGEGWGLTTDGKHLIVSDGSHFITYYEIPENPLEVSSKSLKKINQIMVMDRKSGRPIHLLNELEYVNGLIFSNVWYKDVVLSIDPKTGNIIHRFDLTLLYPKTSRNVNADCLNGIAYDPSQQNFIVTGKLWLKYFRVELDTSSLKIEL